jgi:6-phosphogluconolactonase
VTPPRIEVHDSSEALATAVAGELLTRLADAQAGGAVPQIALTGGSIAEAVHLELARLSGASEVDWSQVVVWWGDERFVEPASDDRNERAAREAFLDQVDPDPAKIHPMPSTESAASLEDGAAAYGEELRAHGAGEFDVVMLGVGPDGHIASLFPGFPQLDDTDHIAVAVTDSPKPPPERITLTFAALNRARSVWFLVSGDEKADAVARALTEGTDPHDTPAAGVTGSEETIWFLDRDSASRL